MTFDRGLELLREQAKDTNWFPDFLILEARLRENLHRERLYGVDLQLQGERAAIVTALNKLCLQYLNMSFNDLCTEQLILPFTKSMQKPQTNLFKIGFVTDNLDDIPAYLAVRQASQENSANIEVINRFSSEGHSVIKNLWSILLAADLVIFDIDREDINLFYEIGLAHGLGKMVLILTSEKLKLPADLLSQTVFTYENSEQGVNKLSFMLSKFMNEVLHKKKKLQGILGPREATIQAISKPIQAKENLQNILSLESPERVKHLEEWFRELAHGVDGWDIISNLSTEQRDKGYDLIIWNSSQDAEIAALGTPIPVEFKVRDTIQKEFIEYFVNRCQLQNFKSAILAITTQATISNRKHIREIFGRQNFLLILLDYNDLTSITSSATLVKQIKLIILDLIYG